MNLELVIPELLIFSGICVILIIDLFLNNYKNNNALIYLSSVITLLISTIIIVINFGNNLGLGFNGHFIKDNIGDILKISVYIALIISFVNRFYTEKKNLINNNFYIFGLFTSLGISITVSAGTFITIFMGLELLSIPMYMVYILNDKSVINYEISIKYFLNGAIASSILLYGMSLVYGLTGTINLININYIIEQLISESLLQNQIFLIFGIILIILGASFKFGSLPLQSIFSVNNKNINYLLDIIPKLIGITIILRLSIIGNIIDINDFINTQQIIPIMIFLIIMTIGNLIFHKSIKKNHNI